MRTLLMLCSSAALLAGCAPAVKLNTPPPPREWLACAAAPDVPRLDPLRTYAKPEVDARDSVIARYIVALRAAHGDCEGALARLRDYYAGAE